MKFFSEKSGYYYLFDPNTGVAIRGGSSGKDPFWKESGPELLDVSITNFCQRECAFCYRQSNSVGKHMDVCLYKAIMQEAKEIGVFQVALGGGNPNQHPDFISILRMTREYGIIPSYTTNGQGMTDAIYKATKEYAGAIAISWYAPYENIIEVIEKCRNFGILVNIHFILNSDTIKEAMRLLNCQFIDNVNAVVFLNYKPLGRGYWNCLRKSKELSQFFDFVLHYDRCKIGFDSCMISYLVSYSDVILPESVDFCEAARFSAFISEDGMMYPCSFMCGAGELGYSVKKQKIGDIWKNAEGFIEYRRLLNTKSEYCVSCDKFNTCHGGCRKFEINCN